MTKHPEGHIGWLEHTVSGIAGSIERSVFTEEHAHKKGWLQSVDPRAKLGMFVAMILAASLTGSVWVLAALYVVALAAAWVSKVPFDFFIKRVWLGIPFFAGIVVIPSIFFVPGARLFDIALGGFHIAPSIPGLIGAAILVARVGVSVSLAVLLVLTTSWSDLLKSLQAVRVPQIFIVLLSMTYRYIFLFLHTTNGLFEVRKSRMVGKTGGSEQRAWIVGSMGSLAGRSFKMSNDVYAAMLARGFTGKIISYSTFRIQPRDWVAFGATLLFAAAALTVGRYM